MCSSEFLCQPHSGASHVRILPQVPWDAGGICAGGVCTLGVWVSIIPPVTRLYQPAPLLLVLLWGQVTSEAPAWCKGTVTRCHPQRVPVGAECPQPPETPPPRSPSRTRGTNLCRLGDFCLPFCFVLRCPCNCLLNPDCISFIADGARSRKALPWAAQPALVLLLGPNAVTGGR